MISENTLVKTNEVSIDIEQIKYALEHDREFFIQFFLGDRLTVPVPDLHIEVMELMISAEVPQLCLAIPRAHAKTTIAKLTAVHYFQFSDYNYILYMTNTIGHAVESVNDIIEYLKSPNYTAVFGEVKFETEQAGHGFYKFTLPNGKRCILKAFSQGQNVRGTNIQNSRPQLVIVDDLEDNDNIATLEAYTKLTRWVFGPFKKAVDQFKHKWIWIGNMIALQSILYENCKSEFWYSRIYGCLKEDGTPLWKDLWSIEALQQDYAEYCSRNMADIWFAEMMNMPTAGGKGIIQAEDITYAPLRLPEDVEYGFITIDLAVSRNTWAHETVIVCHGFVPEGGANGQWQIVEYRPFQGIDVISLFWQIIECVAYWNFRLIGIESVAFQASLKYVYRHLCLENHIENLEFVDVPATLQKPQRIIPWAAMVKSGEYALNEGDFRATQQLLMYRPDKRSNEDDIIDGCAHGPYMMRNFMHKIMESFQYKQFENVQGSYEICDI